MTGSRDMTDRDLMATAIGDVLASGWHPAAKDIVIVHGNYRGADQLADEIARKAGMQTEPHDANWSELGPKAGPLRNQEMVDAGAAVCLAFPHRPFGEGGGTWDCVKRALAAGIPVRIYPLAKETDR